MSLVDKTCKSTVWITPKPLLHAIRKFFGGPILMDPATEPDNPTEAVHFYTEADNGLSKDWGLDCIFVNPPYGDQFKYWVRGIGDRAMKGAEIVALLPGNRTETAYVQDWLLNDELTALVFIRKRLKFSRPDGTPANSNPYGSVLWVYSGPSTESPYWKHLKSLGKVLFIEGVA